ncbi:MAG: hypothetical protein LBE06_01175 [Azoarcus sp.]|jgi:hypothetical protein|nr:hypothetical protein [Azoarcus sp.]
MKPLALKKGDAVIITGWYDGHPRAATFAFRNPPSPGRRNGKCCFIVDEFVGLNGPNDAGRLFLADADVRRGVERAR